MVRLAPVLLSCALLLMSCASRSAHLRPLTDGTQRIEVQSSGQPAGNENTYRLDGVHTTQAVTTTRSGVLTRDFLKKMPTGRSYQSAVGLAAGTTRGANGNTARPSPRPAPAPDQVARTDPEESTPSPVPDDRMVHYDAHATLRATRPADVLDAAERVATDHGGRVDKRYQNTVTLRVPVDRFAEAWAACTALGDLLDQSVRADDITERFVAVDLRVKTLTHTRDRLVALLAKATTEEEKLALLAQITRVTLELDGFLTKRRALADLAAFSRIHLTVSPRKAYSGAQNPSLAGMSWIAAISPFRRQVFYDDKRLALPEPGGMVSLSDKGPFIAESADGAVLWTTRLRNDPQGDAAFWIDAVQERIAGSFDIADRPTLGAWSCLLLDEAGADAPYRWQICVRPDGRHLELAQVFYPSPEAVDRYSERVAGALRVGSGT